MFRTLQTTTGFLALLLLAPLAWGHGGQFRGPIGGVPPSLRDPHDPAPPPPPPSPPPPVTEGPKTPPNGGPPTGQPPVTPGNGPITPPGELGGGAGGRRSQLTFESWMFWYGNNKEGIERLKETIYRREVSDSPLDVLGNGRETGSSRSGATQPTIAKVASHVVPALLWALDPTATKDPDIEGSAYIALAKVTRDAQHIDRIRKGLAPKNAGGRPDLVRESAALALGLLRRGDEPARFTGPELDRVREHLFEVFEDGDEFATRTRGLAALSIGLLGDQAFGAAADPDAGRDAARGTSQRLYDLLARDYSTEDLPIGLLLALGLQRPENVPAAVLDGLTEAAVKGRLNGRAVSGIVQSYAVLTGARLHDVRLARPFAALLAARTTDVHVRRSAAIALGVLGRILPPDDRAALAKQIRESLERASDGSTQNFGLMSLAYLAAAELAENRTGVLVDAKIGEHLLAAAREGSVLQRPFGALALGWILREMPDVPPTAAHGTFRQAAVAALREGLASKALEARNRAAFAVALGMARDLGSRPSLLAAVGDARADRDLRGYSAVAVGLMGSAPPEVTRTLRVVVAERASEELTLHAATALGLLRDTGAVDLLVETLRRVESQHAKGQMVVALSRIGDARAVEPLVRVLQDTTESNGTRALACAGLGVVGDLEWLPSLSRLSRDLNYRASVDLVAEVLSIL